MVMSQEQKDCIYDGSVQSKLLSEYLNFLCHHRGLTEDTIRFRRNDVVSFLKSLRLGNESEDIGKGDSRLRYQDG
jgi:site-specific recombinase XerD